MLKTNYKKNRLLGHGYSERPNLWGFLRQRNDTIKVVSKSGCSNLSGNNASISGLSVPKQDPINISISAAVCQFSPSMKTLHSAKFVSLVMWSLNNTSIFAPIAILSVSFHNPWLVCADTVPQGNKLLLYFPK